MKILGPVCALMGLGLIFFVGGFFFHIVIPTLFTSTLAKCFHIVLACIVLFNIYFNYVLCIATNPGSLQQTIATGMVSPADDNRIPGTFCRQCNSNRPVRAHHCAICDTCVLKMDHHCPWVNNCVGQNNYKYFLCFLVWLAIGCMYNIVVVSAPFFQHIRGEIVVSPVPIYSWVFIFCTSVSALFAVGILFLWHLYLVLTAQTTIEFHINRAIARRSVPPRSARSPYDRGMRSNWESVFGRHRHVIYGILPNTIRPGRYADDIV